MSILKVVDYCMPAASLGENNPLPDLRPDVDIHAKIEVDAKTVTQEESQYMGWGKVAGCLPYLVQDGYYRHLKERIFKAVLLENRFISAVFLPELGGRLWSLVDKSTGKELLFKNPVFQPANLAIRNAWFAGGVEWNCGIIGHTPFTCSPLHTQTFNLKDGTPVLRMYEYEAIRKTIFCIEAFLPEDSRFLFVRPRIINTREEETCTYWWSNIAVNEAPDVRVLAPAQKAFQYGYSKLVTKIDIPISNGLDLSYTTNVSRAMDLFYNIPSEHRKWVTALNGEGYGLIQTSTDLLKSRKLFLWGMGRGGRKWQEFLACQGCSYIEIQAGLASTQFEHLPFPGKAVWSWLEAYGPIYSEAVHGDYPTACNKVDEALEQALPRASFDQLLVQVSEELDQSRGATILQGSGWGALERKAIQGAGKTFIDGGLEFSDVTLTEDQSDWVNLVTGLGFGEKNPLDMPRSYQIDKNWITLMESASRQHPKNWHLLYLLSVAKAYHNAYEEAYNLCSESITVQPSPWAYCLLSELEIQFGDRKDKACDYLKKALDMKPHQAIVCKCLDLLNKKERYFEAETIYQKLPRDTQYIPRIRFTYAATRLGLKDFSSAEEILANIVLADVREGETSLTDLWYKLEAQKLMASNFMSFDHALEYVKRNCIPPENLDFRVNPAEL